MSTLRRPVVLAGIALVAVGLIATLASWSGSGSGSGSDSTPNPVEATASTTSPPSVPDPLDTSPKARVARFQAMIAERPENWQALAGLGAAYVAEAAITGDPSLYPRAEASLDRSLKIHPDDNLQATVAHSSLAAARHKFPLALDWAEKAQALAPDDPNVKGVLGDAQLELGRYDEAFATFQQMIDRRPDLPSYSRISYARELQGDDDGAVLAMTRAESAASSKSDAAFAAFQLGELEWNRGNAEAAVGHYQRAEDLDPTAVRAEAALARAAYFAGDVKGAIEQYQDVVARLPLPQYVSELADIYTVTDQPKLAQQQLELLDAQRKLYEAGGVRVDADFAIINANNGTNLASSLKAMQAEYRVRKSIVVADALAWVLHENGRDRDALTYADKALELGTRNALFLYHRSEIHRALGDEAAADADLAQAKSINPNFSIRYAAGR